VRPGGGGVVASREGVAWWSAVVEVAAGGCLAKIWDTRAPDGLGRASDRLGRVGGAAFMVLPRGGDDESGGLGMAARRSCCNRAAGALRARPGQCEPGVLLMFYRVDDRRSAVEVGSSRPAVE
jgi:hypothetical protein